MVISFNVSVCLFFFFVFLWGEKAEVTVAVLPFLITGELWIVQAHRFVKFIRVSIICYISSEI